MNDMTTKAEYDSREEAEGSSSESVSYWKRQIDDAGKTEKDWRDKAVKILAEYDEQSKDKNSSSFNVLWSNTEILSASLYATVPAPDVRARQKSPSKVTNPQFAETIKQKAMVAKAAADVLEESLRFYMDYSDFDASAEAAVLDSLLIGRAVTRLTYTPRFDTVTPEPIPQPLPDGTVSYMEQQPYDKMVWADIGYSAVQYDDFRRGAAKRWEDTPWVAFRHFYTKEQFQEQYPEFKAIQEISFDHTTEIAHEEQKPTEDKQSRGRALVWEIWDKETKKVLHFCPCYESGFVQVLDDPLQLTGFYPIPKPLYAVPKSHSLVPTPLYSYYERQAKELDRISGRISRVVEAIRVRGIYDKTMTEVARLLDAGENSMIAAENVAVTMENGGLDRAIWFMPIEKMAAVVAVLYQQREQTKQVIYEITGLSDILRGASNPNETLGAQQLKAQTGSARMKKIQSRVQKYFRDILRIQSEIIAEHVPAELLSLMTGKEVSPEMMQVMQQDLSRSFMIDIETDSTVAGDEQRDIENMSAMFGGMSQYIGAVGPAVESGHIPGDVAYKILKDVLRKFKFGKEVLDSLDDAENKPQQPQGGQGQQENQAEMAKIQAEAQMQQQKMQMETQLRQAEMQQQMQIEQMKLQAEMQRFEMELQHKERLATIDMEMKYDQQERDSVRRSDIAFKQASQRGFRGEYQAERDES